VIIFPSVGAWAPWVSVLTNVNLHLNQWMLEGALVWPLTVVALRDSDGQQLLGLVVTQDRRTALSEPLIPVFPLTVTITDNAGKTKHLNFPTG
jgi:hypothetical protein